jgi:chromatin assembly factor 1 subunit A
LNKDSRDSVRTILNELTDAEVAGDISATRLLLSLLEDRIALPAKVFIFHEDTRPGYFGTWTRDSSVIGPRRPIARDVVAIDYSYDSSEEWEETPGDAVDVAGDSDDDEELDVGEDSDADSWLVEDNDDHMEAVATVEEANMVPHSKRPLEGVGGVGNSYKKRRVVPLVPFVKGPVWDPTINKATDEAFTPFRVRFFNGALLVV